MKKIPVLLLYISVLFFTACKQPITAGYGGHIPVRVSAMQANGFVNLDGIFFYIDADDNGIYEESTDTKLAFKNGILILPDLAKSTPENTFQIVRISPINGTTKKIYGFYSTSSAATNLVYTNNIQAVTGNANAALNTAAAGTGWFLRFGFDTSAKTFGGSALGAGSNIEVKTANTVNPLQITIPVAVSDDGGTFSLNDIDFFLGNRLLEYKDGKLLLSDVSDIVQESTALPIVLKSKSGLKNYSFIDGTTLYQVVFANILSVSQTAASVGEGWFTRYNKGTQDSPYSYKELTTTSDTLFITVDSSAPSPNDTDDSNFGITGYKETAFSLFTPNLNEDSGVPIENLFFYMDINGDSKYTKGTDIPVNYGNGNIKLPLFAPDKFSANTAVQLKAQYMENSQRSYVFVNNNADLTAVEYVTQKSGVTDGWNVRISYSYTPLDSVTSFGVRQRIRVITQTLAVSQNSSIDTRIFDLSKIEFYLDVNNNGKYDSEDILMPYSDGSLTLADVNQKVPLGKSRKVRIKSVLPNSLRQLGFTKNNIAVDLVFANMMDKFEGWYLLSGGAYTPVIANIPNVAVTILANTEQILTSTGVTGNTIVASSAAPAISSLAGFEFYLDMDKDNEYSPTIDYDLEFFVTAAGAKSGYLVVPTANIMITKIPEGEYRFVRVKQTNGTYYDFSNSSSAASSANQSSTTASGTTGSPIALHFSNKGPNLTTQQTWGFINTAFAALTQPVYIRPTSSNGAIKDNFPTDK